MRVEAVGFQSTLAGREIKARLTPASPEGRGALDDVGEGVLDMTEVQATDDEHQHRTDGRPAERNPGERPTQRRSPEKGDQADQRVAVQKGLDVCREGPFVE